VRASNLVDAPLRFSLFLYRCNSHRLPLLSYFHSDNAAVVLYEFLRDTRCLYFRKMLVEVYKEPVFRTYIAPRCSVAYVVSIAFHALAMFMPFFLAYPFHENGSIWLKEGCYWEQPKVKFKYQMISVFQAKDMTNNGIVKEIFYSTLPAANLIRSNIRMATVRAREIDENLDGVTDKFWVNLDVPLEEGEEIYSVQTVLFFDYQLHDQVKLRTDGLLYFDKYSAIDHTGISMTGKLSFIQALPFQLDKTIHLYPDDPVLNDDLVSKDVRETNIHSIMEKHSRRSNIMRISYADLIWTSRQQKSFNLTASIDVPLQQIRYIPNSWDILKDAWIKYLSMLIIVAYFIRSFCGFLFTCRM